MDVKGQEIKMNWICVFFLTALVSVVVSAPTDLQDDCIEPCKDIESLEDKGQCISKHCSDSEIKRVVGSFVRIGKSSDNQYEDDIPLEDAAKRASHFVRIGKAARNSFVRIGKPSNPNSFVRIGKANHNSFVRIGKSYPRYFLRMIKGYPSAFVRIGRGNPGSFVRIGKSADESQTEQLDEDKRMSSFVRIGKANPSSFVRIGKANPSSFVRIGRRPEQEESDSLNYDGSEPQSMESRNDPSTFLRLG